MQWPLRKKNKHSIVSYTVVAENMGGNRKASLSSGVGVDLL
jgi:hypothetical protein